MQEQDRVDILHGELKQNSTHPIDFHHIRGNSPGIFALGGYSANQLINTVLGQALIRFVRERHLDLLIMNLPQQVSVESDWSTFDLTELRAAILALTSHFRMDSRLAVGASLGGWLLLSAQQRDAKLFSNMILLAPAVDWDLIYFLPQIRMKNAVKDVTPKGDFLSVPSDNVAVPFSFLRSAEHIRIDPSQLHIPHAIHILQGRNDHLVPRHATEQLVTKLRAKNSVIYHDIAGYGHEVAKLEDHVLVEMLEGALTSCLQSKI